MALPRIAMISESKKIRSMRSQGKNVEIFFGLQKLYEQRQGYQIFIPKVKVQGYMVKCG